MYVYTVYKLNGSKNIEIMEKADDTITEFDEEMWLGLVDFVTIKNKEDILVSLKGGMQIAV